MNDNPDNPRPTEAQPPLALNAGSGHPRSKPLRIGGVMRCCAATLDSTLVQEIEGETLQCKYALSNPLHSLRFRDGCWEWNHD